ncbi:MAG: PhoH family protein [Alistipes sp.]|nr:PhoH family protein [Alistipes sp.]
MSEEILKEIMIEGVDARELYGAQNAYLEQMRELMPKLKIVARGDTIKALGAKEDVAAFERRMNALVEYYLKYGHISSEVVSQAFSSSLSELSAEPPAIDKDVIVYGNNGAIIRARTINQQRLVKLSEKCDLMFAVGPAGSGKTYTAIALAVRA